MKTSIFVMVLMAIIMLSIGCTKSHFRQMAASAIANGADTEVKYNVLECRTLQQRCVQKIFRRDKPVTKRWVVHAKNGNLRV
jgi:hypothetical protein